MKKEKLNPDEEINIKPFEENEDEIVKRHGKKHTKKIPQTFKANENIFQPETE